jgi:uncharacterized protein
VALDPNTAGAGRSTVTTASTSSTTTTIAANRSSTARTTRIAPYYLFMQLPGEEQPEFILLRPFVPTSARDDNQVLTAFMVGQSDGEDYGKLRVYVMPRGAQVPGPALVQGEIESEPAVSETQTLLDGPGSSVTYGSLTGIPIDGGLIYVRPFYVTSTQSQIPSLQRVIVYFGGDVAIRNTLQEALTAIFGDAPPTLEDPSTPVDPGAPAGPIGTVAEQVTALLIEASALFDQADEALAQRDLAEYQDLVEEARAKTREAEQLLEADGAGTTTTTTVAGASA